MPAITCKRCGKLFRSVNRVICPECLEKEKQSYQTVEKYLRENPGATVAEIAQNTEVDEKVILKFIKEGRLKEVEVSVNLKCEACGKPIASGRLCPACMSKFSAGLNTAGSQNDKASALKKGMLSKRLKDEK